MNNKNLAWITTPMSRGSIYSPDSLRFSMKAIKTMSTLIRRKQAFCVLNARRSKHAAVPCYLHRHPDSDYQRHRQQSHGKMWVGQHRHLISRQLVRIKQLPRASLSICEKLSCISHDNVVRPESFYYETENNNFFIVFEYLHLNVFDLFPLHPEEVSCIMKQVSLSFSGDCDG